jgi:hypothetical protein
MRNHNDGQKFVLNDVPINPLGDSLGGERKDGRGEEERLASAKEVCPSAVQVHNGNPAFLLMAEVMVVTATASTVSLGASLSLGAGTLTIIPGLLSLQQRPRQQRQ